MKNTDSNQDQPSTVSADDINIENAYLKANDIHLPFSTTLRADLYLKLKRIQHHDPDVSAREVIEKAIEEYVSNNPFAEKPLSERARKKLKPIKRTYDYRKELKERNNG